MSHGIGELSQSLTQVLQFIFSHLWNLREEKKDLKVKEKLLGMWERKKGEGS
jgi:hypothetical protein